MKYQDKKFTVPYTSKQYRDNWDSVFNPLNFEVGDLVAVKELGGHWSHSKWVEDSYPSFWFGIVKTIRDKSSFEGEPNVVVMVELFNNETGTMGWEWVDKNNVTLVIKDVYSFLRKDFESDTRQKESISEN